MNDSQIRNCQVCNSTITPQQIAQRQAGLVQGVLLCPACVEKKRQQLMQAHAAQVQAGAAAHGGPVQQLHAPPAQQAPPAQATDESISLVGTEADEGSHMNLIRSFAAGSTLGGAHQDSAFNRPLANANEPATRCRTFHGKLTAAGLAHMDDQINEWLDGHPEVYIKHATSSVGVFEAKTKEPHLLITMFY